MLHMVDGDIGTSTSLILIAMWGMDTWLKYRRRFVIKVGLWLSLAYLIVNAGLSAYLSTSQDNTFVIVSVVLGSCFMSWGAANGTRLTLRMVGAVVVASIGQVWGYLAIKYVPYNPVIWYVKGLFIGVLISVLAMNVAMDWITLTDQDMAVPTD